ncbi:MAG: hypothetical protein H0U16_07895 [Actinobacteria bacterium]|nr:hypothetical protein [Actinomycetota bacterium]
MPGDRQYTEYYDTAGARTFREYYNLATDPHQLTNLFGDRVAANEPPTASIVTQLNADKTCVGASCP